MVECPYRTEETMKPQEYKISDYIQDATKPPTTAAAAGIVRVRGGKVDTAPESFERATAVAFYLSSME